MAKLKTLWRKLQSSPKQSPFHLATEEDVYYCYRLLLNREPDEPGWLYWTNLVHQHHLGLDTLVDNFVSGDEFLQRQAERYKPHLVELPQFRMYVRLNDHFIGATIAREKAYEPYVAQVLSSVLGARATFIDVGANIGYFSLMAAALVGNDGQVVAFEPQPGNCELLRQSIAENGFNHIQLHENAVAERQQRVTFSRVGGADSNGRLLSPIEAQSQRVPPLVVEAVTLDETVADLERVDVIKLDIEGAEPKAWQGMQQVVRRHSPLLVLEFSPHLIELTSQVQPVSFLSELQHYYDLHVIDRQTGLSETAQSPEAIMQIQSKSGLTHLDLLARPR